MSRRLSAFRSALFDAVTHLLGYDCHVMVGAAAAAHLDTPRGGPLSFSITDHGKGDREFRGLGITMIVSPLRVHPQAI